MEGLGLIIGGIILLVIGLLVNRLFVEQIIKTIGYIVAVIGAIALIVGVIILALGLGGVYP